MRKYIKYDFVEQNSILLFQNTKYIFEIDISKYKTGEYIFFLINGDREKETIQIRLCGKKLYKKPRSRNN